ncbi:hypothetical protein T4E_12125 [Trichinella pseudospiralis]|uniref:Uncharacterized protein n=1 Tax=Trichinella pseudospiralis TaxID=6337 RepID=A0A0V0XPI0_TRIPS|nr:hypothetical protein T4E_12125 [Trichinella pseudospiralis]
MGFMNKKKLRNYRYLSRTLREGVFNEMLASTLDDDQKLFTILFAQSWADFSYVESNLGQPMLEDQFARCFIVSDMKNQALLIHEFHPMYQILTNHLWDAILFDFP